MLNNLTIKHKHRLHHIDDSLTKKLYKTPITSYVQYNETDTGIPQIAVDLDQESDLSLSSSSLNMSIQNGSTYKIYFEYHYCYLQDYAEDFYICTAKDNTLWLCVNGIDLSITINSSVSATIQTFRQDYQKLIIKKITKIETPTVTINKNSLNLYRKIKEIDFATETLNIPNASSNSPIIYDMVHNIYYYISTNNKISYTTSLNMAGTETNVSYNNYHSFINKIYVGSTLYIHADNTLYKLDTNNSQVISRDVKALDYSTDKIVYVTYTFESGLTMYAITTSNTSTVLNYPNNTNYQNYYTAARQSDSAYDITEGFTEIYLKKFGNTWVFNARQNTINRESVGSGRYLYTTSEIAWYAKYSTNGTSWSNSNLPTGYRDTANGKYVYIKGSVKFGSHYYAIGKRSIRTYADNKGSYTSSNGTSWSETSLLYGAYTIYKGLLIFFNDYESFCSSKVYNKNGQEITPDFMYDCYIRVDYITPLITYSRQKNLILENAKYQIVFNNTFCLYEKVGDTYTSILNNINNYPIYTNGLFILGKSVVTNTNYYEVFPSISYSPILDRCTKYFQKYKIQNIEKYLIDNYQEEY